VNISRNVLTGSTSARWQATPDGRHIHVADAYMFTVLRWSPRVGIDLSKWSNVEGYLDWVAARPKVKQAMQAEGLLQ
jgi:glutathione S-transferase